ncbi:MAG: hypothetical protein ABEL76_15510 [Bradymonadaceae bacterium]
MSTEHITIELPPRGISEHQVRLWGTAAGTVTAALAAAYWTSRAGLGDIGTGVPAGSPFLALGAFVGGILSLILFHGLARLLAGADLVVSGGEEIHEIVRPETSPAALLVDERSTADPDETADTTVHFYWLYDSDRQLADDRADLRRRARRDEFQTVDELDEVGDDWTDRFTEGDTIPLELSEEGMSAAGRRDRVETVAATLAAATDSEVVRI